MTKPGSINREVALAGQQVRRKVIFALTLCSIIPLLLLTYAFHAPVREFLGPIVGLSDSVSVPALLAFTALLMAGGAFIVWDIATALSRAAQLSNEQSPELPTEPSRKDEIGTLMSSFARMLATIEQQSQEINEFPRRLDQLIREAFRDSLTGLPNRALFMDRLTHALTRAERGGSNLAVLFLDLDRFKILNDTLGQEVGDRLLVEVGHRLAGCLSPEDTVARLGGDEFALLLEDTSDLRGATALAEKVSAEIQRPFVVDGRDVLISASIGVALTGGGSMQPEEVLHNADLAMYQAKAEGRARYELYEPGLSVSTRERLDLQADLRTAGARQELSLRFQPVIALGTMRAVEVEALVRWDHRRRGALLPADFIGLSEETGLILPMGRWILREACRQARAWQAEASGVPPLIVSVNLSAGQFERDALAEEVATILRETGFEPRRLQLEISEAVLMRDDPRMFDRLDALKALGVRLAIDDFGTGYASLSYLKRLPVDCLKIDRSLVKGVGYETEDTAIIRAVSGLAHSLGITVTAEGIETAGPARPAPRGRLRSGPGLLLRAAGRGRPRARSAGQPRRRRASRESLMARLTLRGLARTLVVRLIGIVAFTGALGIGLSWLLEMAVSEPEWTETAAVAQRAVDRSGLPELLAGQNARSPKRWAEESARFVRELPGVVNIKVWDPQGTVVWAVQSGFIGQRSDGHELRDAISGRVAVRFSSVALPDAQAQSFVSPNVADLFVPVYGPGAGRVVGVVELSQAPLRMDQAHERWSVLAWNIALGTGGILCLILLPAAWRSHRRTMSEASSTSQRSVQRTQELQRTTEQLRDALKAVKQRAEETDRMLEVTEAIGSAIEQKALFEVIAHGAARACRVDRGSIFLRDKSGQLMVPVSSQHADRAGAARGADGAETLRALALEEMPSFLLEAVRRQEPVVISDPGSDPRVPQGWVGLFQAKSALVVPLIHQGRTAGVLILDHLKTLHVFTDEEIRLATTLAAQAAVALEKARLYDEIQQRLQQTETLLAVSQAIGSAPDLPEAVRRTTREMVRILGADTGVAWCVTGGGDRFIPLAGYHVPRELREPLSGLPLAPDDPLLDLVKRLRTALHSSNSKTDPRFNQAALQLLPQASLLIQPVQVSDELLGIFAISWVRDAHVFTMDDLRLADGIAKQAAVAIELHRTQRHIIEQERLNAVGKMASGLAHDFNNALVPISGYAEMLLEHPEILQDAVKSTKYLKLIMTGVEDAASVVSRLREFYRKREEGETYRPLSLNKMVEQAVALTRPRWRDEALGSGRTILVEADMRPVPRILGSESEMREMLANLIFNAVDAMPEGGLIRIRTGMREASASEETPLAPRVPQVFLEVSDTGTGMTEDVRRRCLEPFFSTKGERGTGLGLPMVYGIVKRHRGTMDIESTVGKGTTFIVLLPADTSLAREVQQRAQAPSSGPLHVLVVDDEPIARDVLSEYLMGDGHTVDTAVNGREAFEKFKAGRYALVITDRAMPEVGGDQLAAMVKEVSPDTPIILLTGFGDLMNAAGEKPDGVDMVVKKPIRLATLREVLSKMTDPTRAAEAETTA